MLIESPQNTESIESDPIDPPERITSVTKGSSNVAYSITYEPFGPVTGLTYGNGITETRNYDQDYRVTAIAVPNTLSWQLAYNAGDDLTSITDELNSSNTQTFTTDLWNELDTAQGAYGSINYSSYNDGMNRTYETINGSQTNYTYNTTTGRLSSLSGGTNKTYSYDADGNLTSDGTNTYTYDDTNRLASVATSSGTDAYQYNGLGQRVEKTAGGVTTVFVYDEAGHLIGEYTSTGGLIAEHIWLNNRPVGVITSAGLYYVQTDQLGTPRVITNSSKTIVWQWHSDPFGNGSPTGSLTYNLRFPGQYYDAETGKDYNYFRDYDPITGRYIESDPIGLWGGINTYTYTSNNPLIWADRFGLAPGDLPPPPPGYNPNAWRTLEWDNGTWVLKDPEGNSYTIHPEDTGHWRHWIYRIQMVKSWDDARSILLSPDPIS